MTDIVICAYARTPVGKFGGSLAGFKASELGSIVIKEVLRRASVKVELVDEVIMGNVLTAGAGQNPARQAALKAGLPAAVSALTVNKVCGSGLKAVMLAAQSLRCGDTDVVIAGGMESMSGAPYLVPDLRYGKKLGHGLAVDSMIQDGLWCAFEDWHMGMAAEHIAKKHKISRKEQDRFAAASQQKAQKAMDEGKFKKEIVPVNIPQRKSDDLIFDKDEGIRGSSDEKALAALKPAFDRKEGSVTAGNASTINDGAAALLLTRREVAEKNNWPIIVTVKEQAVAGVAPKDIFEAPVAAVNKLLKKAGMTLDDIDLIEANEAFAAQVLANGKELGIDESKLNIYGGAIAIGHPIGASGARVLITLISALEQENKKQGLATLCLGGGNAVALRVER
jgi:acetyl-CoA C-acetyltransferase